MLVHPNDDVNKWAVVERHLPNRDAALRRWPDARSRYHDSRHSDTLRDDAGGEGEGIYADIVKIGRTHLYGCHAAHARVRKSPAGYVSQLDHGLRAINARHCPHLSELALGGTAVGTGHQHARRAIRKTWSRHDRYARITGLPVRDGAENKFEALAAHDAIVESARRPEDGGGASLMKIANDIRMAQQRARARVIGEIFDPRQRARFELDYARQGEPHAVRSDDDGVPRR